MLCAGVALAASATSSGAETGSAPDVATLLREPQALVDLLRQHHGDVAAAAARVDQATADIGTARLHPNPGLGLSVSDIPLGQTNPPGLTHQDTLIYGLNLTQTFELGKRSPRIAAARARGTEARESWLGEIGDRTAEARSALGRVVQLRARQALLERSLEEARHVVELETAREQGGDLSGNDLDRLRLDTLGLESDVTRARAELDGAQAACRALIGAGCDPGRATLDDLDAAAALPDDAATSDMLGRAPQFRAQELEQQAAHLDETLARHRRIPDPTIGVGYVRDYFLISGDNPRSWNASVSLGIPLFDRGQHDAARAAAHAREVESESRAAKTRAEADREGLVRRRAFLEEALRKLSADAVPRSTSILDTTQKALDQGESSMTDLLLARRAHTTILLNQLDLRFELFDVRNELRRLLGLDAELARGTGPAVAGERK